MEDNRAKLRDLLLDVFLLDPAEFRWDLKRAQIETWDSLGTVSLAVGIQDVFGHHLTPAEATAMTSVEDIIETLRRKGVPFATA